MSAPTSTNNVTARKLSSCITSLWGKCKDFFQAKLPTSGSASSTYAINISGNAASATTSTDAANHISNTSNPHGVTKSQVGLGNVTNDSQVKRSEMGTANGVATLDAHGIINTSQLPSYVDDVLEYSSKSNFPATGESGKIYVDTSTNLGWRWGGTAYTQISPSIALGETSSTAYRGDRGKIAYDHSQSTHARTDANNSDVAWDTTNKKLTKTVNGTTEEVVTPGMILDSFGDSTENLAGTGIFIAANPQSAWKKYPISKLWNWIQQSIGSILGLYIDSTTQEKRFSGTASEAVTATNATNANLSHSYNSGTAEGESVLQIGNGTAQSCVRAANAYKVYGNGTGSSGYSTTYWELGSASTRPSLTLSKQTQTTNNITKVYEDSITQTFTGGGSNVLDGTGLTMTVSSSNAEMELSLYSLVFSNPGSQASITLSSTDKKIEIAESGNTSIITGPAINTPQIELYGSTRSIALRNNSNNDGLRVCQASNNANLYDLQARKFYGPLQGNVTGNADTATKATQDGNGNNIVNTYAPLSSVLRIGNDSTAEATYDLDTFTARGIYFINIKSGSSNAPGTGHHTLIVTTNSSGTRRWQVAIGYYMKVRRYTGSAWTAWQTIATMPNP